jgi:hypothetical protein
MARACQSALRRAWPAGQSDLHETHENRACRVHRRFHPFAARSDQLRGISVHRRVCAGEPRPVLAMDAARLARGHRDGVVRLLLPRSSPRDAVARRGDRRAGRRAGMPRRRCGSTARAGLERAAAFARFNLHERVRLPCESQPRKRARRTARLPAFSSTPNSTKRARAMNAMAW